MIALRDLVVCPPCGRPWPPQRRLPAASWICGRWS